MRTDVALLALIVLSLGVMPGNGRAQPVRWPSSSPPRPLAARDVSFPPYQLRTLDNGLPVVVVVHSEQPMVTLRLIVRAGAAEDPPGRPGVAAMVATLLEQGTTSRTAREFADAIDSMGGDAATGTGRDLIFANVVVMKDGLSAGMSLLADLWRRPAFAPEEIERYREQTLSALRVGYEDPGYVANVAFDRLVYGFHPYGLAGHGTPESVRRIAREDLIEFHRAYFTPNNCLMAVVGDVTADEAIAQVARAFGDWERRDVSVARHPDPPDPTRRLVVFDKPDAVQTEIRVGQIGIPRTSRDYMAVDLALKILGGEGANRLHRVLRTERALTYGASVECEALLRAGAFTAQTNTRSETTGEVLRLLVDEFARLRRELVDEGELAGAQAYLTGSFPLTIETPNDIATHVLDALFYGLSLDDLQKYRQRVNAITPGDLAVVAGRYLKPDRLSAVLVGNAAAFLDQLARVGFRRVEVVRLVDLDLTAADFKKKAASAGEPTR